MSVKCPKCDSENPDTQSFCGDCGTQLDLSKDIPAQTQTIVTPPQELSRGTTIAGRYEIIEQLGTGGMGSVYRVEDMKIHEDVALKLIKPEIAADKKTIERFNNELKLARKIRHKNICGMYDLGEAEGTHFITMEYVPGEDLKSFMRRAKQLSIPTVISIAKQICGGLEEAHKLGIVHRDLKPSNIMIDKDGNVHIMDFGIARSMKTAGITGTGVMIGTPEYMSPEQVESKEVDQLSDLYSLGVILYEMVTGRVPFEGETPLSIARKHADEAPPDPKIINPQISDDLSNLILKCLEKDKDSRFQSAGELRSELENIEKGIPTTDTVIPKRKPLTSKEITVTFGLKKLFIPVVVIVALAIITVVIWQPWSKKAPTPLPSGKPSLAVVYFENNTGDENLDHWRKSIANLLITDLTQSKYLKVLGGDKLFDILNQLNQLETETYSSEVLKEVAIRGGVNHILRGSYSKAGNIIRIDTVLQDANTGEPIATERVEGTGEESIFSLVDDLTSRVKTSFELTEKQITGDIDSRIEDITTSSPEALKHYHEGVRYDQMGEYRLSLQSMEKAVAIDPDFALAYIMMYWNYMYLNNFTESRKYLQKAYELSERLPAYERYTIQGIFYSRSEKTLDKGIEALNKLLEFYPEDIEGKINLGIAYWWSGQWDKAREQFELLIANKVESVYPYSVLAQIYWEKGMYDKVTEVCEEYFNNFGDNPSILNYLVQNYLFQGKYDLAQAEVDKAISLNLTGFNRFQFYYLQGDIYVCREDWTLAEKEYLKLFDSEELVFQYNGREGLAELYRLQGKFKKAHAQIRQNIELANESSNMGAKSYYHRYLSYLHLMSRSPEKALEECNKAWKIAFDNENLRRQREALHVKGLIHLELKSVDEAERVADELKGMIEKGVDKTLIRLYYHLAGRIELERKNFDRAIEHFKKALSLEPVGYVWQVSFRSSLAQAYYESGDLKKSQEAYEGIISLPITSTFCRDIYAKSFYLLGKICEEQVNTTKAIEYFEKFLDLWKDADLGIAEVDDARERLAGLKSQ